jgi:membrane protein DedA with SNARE-associated domain
MALEAIIQTYGYPALFVGTFLEGETILVVAGFAAYRGYLDLRWVIPVAFLGTFVSDQLFFHLGHKKGRSLIAGHPKWQWRADRVQALLDRYHLPVILGFRFVYGLRNVTPFVIGTSGFSPLRFFILNFIGAWAWALIIGGLGFVFGRAIEALLADVQRYERYVLAFLLIGGLVLWMCHMMWARHQRRES